MNARGHPDPRRGPGSPRGTRERRRRNSRRQMQLPRRPGTFSAEGGRGQSARFCQLVRTCGSSRRRQAGGVNGHGAARTQPGPALTYDRLGGVSVATPNRGEGFKVCYAQAFSNRRAKTYIVALNSKQDMLGLGQLTVSSVRLFIDNI